MLRFCLQTERFSLSCCCCLSRSALLFSGLVHPHPCSIQHSSPLHILRSCIPLSVSRSSGNDHNDSETDLYQPVYLALLIPGATGEVSDQCECGRLSVHSLESHSVIYCSFAGCRCPTPSVVGRMFSTMRECDVVTVARSCRIPMRDSGRNYAIHMCSLEREAQVSSAMRRPDAFSQLSPRVTRRLLLTCRHHLTAPVYVRLAAASSPAPLLSCTNVTAGTLQRSRTTSIVEPKCIIVRGEVHRKQC